MPESVLNTRFIEETSRAGVSLVAATLNITAMIVPETNHSQTASYLVRREKPDAIENHKQEKRYLGWNSEKQARIETFPSTEHYQHHGRELGRRARQGNSRNNLLL